MVRYTEIIPQTILTILTQISKFFFIELVVLVSIWQQLTHVLSMTVIGILNRIYRPRTDVTELVKPNQSWSTDWSLPTLLTRRSLRELLPRESWRRWSFTSNTIFEYIMYYDDANDYPLASYQPFAWPLYMGCGWWTLWFWCPLNQTKNLHN